MNTSMVSIRVAWALLVLTLLMDACRSAPSEPRVTITGDKCSYAGPKQIPTKLTVTWSIRNATPSSV